MRGRASAAFASIAIVSLTVFSGLARAAQQASISPQRIGDAREAGSRTRNLQTDGPIVFASVQRRSKVLVFKQTDPSSPSRVIRDLCAPNGLAVDAEKNLYVAQVCVGSGVAIIPPGKSKPVATLIDPGYLSTDVAVAADRTAYVISNGGSFATIGHVAIFAPGATSPQAHISDFCGQGIGVALDQNDDLYVSYYDCKSGLAHIRKYSAGASTGVDLMLQGLLNPEGMVVDASGNLVLANLSPDNSEIDSYAPGSTAAFSRYRLKALVHSVALSADGLTLYASVEHLYARSYVYAFQYPAMLLTSKYAVPMQEHAAWAAISPARF